MLDLLLKINIIIVDGILANHIDYKIKINFSMLNL